MKRFFYHRKLLFFMVSIVLFVLLAIASLWNSGQNIVSEMSVESMGLVNRAVSVPANFFGGIFENLTHLFNTYDENKELRHNVLSAAEIQNKYEALEQENARLKEELELKKDLSDYEVITGAVISRTPDTWSEQLNINIGMEQGVEPGMMVVSRGGLIGRILTVSNTSAKVSLLSNTNKQSVSISAAIMTDNQVVVYGIVDSYDRLNNRFEMINIDARADIKEGQLVVTSGLANISPRGLSIGKIESVELENNGLFKKVVIVPSGDMKDVRYVSVIKRQSEKITNE